MRALTLTQPWAGLVASGIKLIENRPRSIVKREDFGKPFAIHASREIDAGAERIIADIDPDLLTIARNPDGGEDRFYRKDWHHLARVTSAVIGVATIERVVAWQADAPRLKTAADLDTGAIIDLGDQRRWFFGPIGYVLRDVVFLATPVECKGALGFWRLPLAVENKVRERLGQRPRPTLYPCGCSHLKVDIGMCDSYLPDEAP